MPTALHRLRAIDFVSDCSRRRRTRFVACLQADVRAVADPDSACDSDVMVPAERNARPRSKTVYLRTDHDQRG